MLVNVYEYFHVTFPSVHSPLHTYMNLVRIGSNSPAIKTEAFHSPSPLAIFIPFNHLYSLQLVRLEWKQLVTVSSVS